MWSSVVSCSSGYRIHYVILDVGVVVVSVVGVVVVAVEVAAVVVVVTIIARRMLNGNTS